MQDKYMVFEIAQSLNEDDKEIANGLTKEEAQQLIDENPELRVMIPHGIIGG